MVFVVVMSVMKIPTSVKFEDMEILIKFIKDCFYVSNFYLIKFI